MEASREKPLIGLPACVQEIGDMPYHAAGEKYIAAVAVGAGGMPLVIPSLEPGAANGHDLGRLLESLDGLLVTGSPSNVWPDEYGGEPSRPGTLHDRARDATTLPLIRLAIERALPLLAICRGCQELNVALGGTLHQNIQDLPGRLDHRADPQQPREARYGLAHGVGLAPGGALAELAGENRIEVNSLHAQGIDRLAPGLAVEATAPDGTVEGVRVERGSAGRPDRAPAFAIGIQWHPEWRFEETLFARRLFAAFGDAARARGAGGRRRETPAA
ncbi:MAG: gamma-glutamyl-gamma-aminobutyrate hydrolase family protein [Alphaproteobacteria bacterium]